MKILAFESSAKSASIAILEDEKILATSYQNIGQTHSKTMMPMLEDMLKQTGINLDEIELLTVATGPGSYTGVRIGVACAQGLAVAKNIDCIGVSSLESLAYNLAEITDREIVAVMDARASRVFYARFSTNGEKAEYIDYDQDILVEDLGEKLKNLNNSYILVGDGAKICYNIFKEKGVDIKISPEHLLYQNACSVAKASKNHTPCNVDKLVPTYLK